jgi:hypothetical protein
MSLSCPPPPHTHTHLATPGNVMPSGREGEMYGGDVKIVVHPMIPAAGRDADKVCAGARWCVVWCVARGA